MPQRFALRFENGERRGEVVAIAGATLTVGRKPGSGLQILDASVSGAHAELIAISGAVHVRDLGSTNGTRIGSERVSERELAHGDELVFGNVRLVFLDAEVGGAPPLTGPAASAVDAAAPPAASSPGRAAAPASASTAGPAGGPEALGEEVRTISADLVARSGKRSFVAAALMLVVVGGAVGGWFWWQGTGARPTEAVTRPVEAVEGNLLATGYSFEDEDTRWTADERAPLEFTRDAGARHFGAAGLAVSLDEVDGVADWALQRSPGVAAPRSGALTARAWVRAEHGAQLQLGLRFEDSAGVWGATETWTRPHTSKAQGDEYGALELTSDVPAGYDTAVVLVLARGPGEAAFDDASLVPAPGGTPDSVGEYDLVLLGEPAGAATLFKIDRLLVSDLHLRPGVVGSSGAVGARVPFTATPGEHGFTLAANAPGRLSLRAEAPLVAGGIATTAAAEADATGGYRTHQVAFERESATSVLLGTGRDLVRLVPDTPGRVSGRPLGSGFRLELDPAAAWELQLVFRDDRVEARNLAHAARQAETEGRVADSIAAWTRLSDEFPFEQALLEEALAARTRLVQSGLAEVRELGQRVERARFFRLVELFRQCRTAAGEVAARFAGTEVEVLARDLEAEIVASSAELERDLDAAERARLESIARALEADSPKLAARVNAYLAEQFGEGE